MDSNPNNELEEVSPGTPEKIQEPDYIAELSSKHPDEKFPPGFNSLDEDLKQGWARNRIEALKGGVKNPETEPSVVATSRKQLLEEELASGEIEHSPELNDLGEFLNSLGIALRPDEEQLEKFYEKQGGLIKEKFKEIKEAVESLPSKENLKEKFSYVRLGYPKDEGESKLLIANKALHLDISADKQEITDFLNKLYVPEEEPQPAPEPQKTTPEAEKEEHSPEWNNFKSTLAGLGIALEYNENQLTKFYDTYPERLKERFIGLKEIIESFPNKNALKEKFSVIRLGYPKYESGTKIFVDGDILYVDLGIEREEVVRFLNELFDSNDKKEETTPEQVQEPDYMEEFFKSHPDAVYPEEFNAWTLDEKQEWAKQWVKTEIEKMRDESASATIISTPEPLQAGDPIEEYLKQHPHVHAPLFSDHWSIEERLAWVEEQERINAPSDAQMKQQSVPVPPPVPPELILQSQNNFEPQTPEPANVEAVSVEGNKIEGWKESIEWQDLERSRRSRAIAEINRRNLFVYGKTPDKSFIKTVSNEKVDELDAELADRSFIYNEQKNIIAQKIRETLRAEAGGNLTPEQETELESKAKEIIFDELVKKENNAYLNSVRMIEGKTWTDKAKEQGRRLAQNRLVQGYMGLNKWVRLAITTTLFTVGGYALGTVAVGGTFVGAAAYGAGRIGRGTASILGGNAARMAAEKYWTEEKINEESKKREEEIKNSSNSLEEKSKMMAELKNWEIDKKKWIKRKKTLVTFGVGMGAGLIAGLTEGTAFGKETSGASEQVGEKKMPTFQEHRTTRGVPQFDNNSAKPVFTPASPPIEPLESVAPETPVAENLFENPADLIHEVKAGDSAWKIMNETLEHSDEFKGMTEAQKTYILSSLTNKMLRSPEDYGIGEGGVLRIGQELNSSKLFEDTGEVKSLFAKAKEIFDENTETGRAKALLVEKNNDAIQTYVNEHPGEDLTPEKVSEILNYKPKVETPEFPAEPQPETVTEEPVLKSDSETIPEPKPEPVTAPVPDTLGTKIEDLKPKPFFESQLSSQPGVEMPKVESVSEVLPADWGTETELPKDIPNKNPVSVEQIHQELSDAKARLAELEGKPASIQDYAAQGRNPNLERSFVSDSESAMFDSKFNQNVEAAYRSGINDIFGKKGFWGMGKMSGIDSPEYKEIARLPAMKVVEYYTGDSARCGLPAEVMDKLSKSSRYGAFSQEMIGLMEQSSGVVKPFENENVESFMKRLIGYVTRNHLKNNL